MRVFTPRHFYAFGVWCLLLAGSTALQGQASNTSPVVLDGHLQRHVITAQSVSQVLTFENLIVGETYSLIVPEDPAMGCMPEIKAEDPGTNVLSYDVAAHQLKFMVTATTMSFSLNYPCNWDASNPPRHYVSVICETCKKKTLNEYLKTMATLEVAPGGSAEDLIRDVLIGGNCFDVTNV
ncbi:MAG TPA: hypothetical protein PK228_01035, partial [Saprospiraceae bacterium]|nr:hypothetical protein [Saprospiraceae bacterium]